MGKITTNARMYSHTYTHTHAFPGSRCITGRFLSPLWKITIRVTRLVSAYFFFLLKGLMETVSGSLTVHQSPSQVRINPRLLTKTPSSDSTQKRSIKRQRPHTQSDSPARNGKTPTHQVNMPGASLLTLPTVFVDAVVRANDRCAVPLKFSLRALACTSTHRDARTCMYVCVCVSSRTPTKHTTTT